MKKGGDSLGLLYYNDTTNSGSRTQILNLKESTRNASQGSQSQLSVHNHSTLEKRRASKGMKDSMTAEKQLPSISTIHQKIQMFKHRCERLLFKQLPKVDQLTADQVQHVSEFCSDIQSNMLEKERKWQVDF